MTIPVQVPKLPDPPSQYNVEYMQRLLKTLEGYMRLVNAPGAIQATNITLTQLPTAATGLPSGALWNDAGIVKIVP